MKRCVRPVKRDPSPAGSLGGASSCNERQVENPRQGVSASGAGRLARGAR